MTLRFLKRGVPFYFYIYLKEQYSYKGRKNAGCNESFYPCGGGEEMVGVGAVEAELVHDPVRLVSFGCAAAVEDERLLHADQRAGAAAADLAVLAGGLPVPGHRGAVGAQPRRVLAVAEAVEVPLLLPHLRLVCCVVIVSNGG